MTYIDGLFDRMDAWRHFPSYRPEPLRSLDEIRADIEALEQETDGLLGRILVGVSPPY